MHICLLYSVYCIYVMYTICIFMYKLYYSTCHTKQQFFINTKSSGKEDLSFIFDSPVPRTEVAELVDNEFLVIKKEKNSTPPPQYLGPSSRWHAQALENSFLLSILNLCCPFPSMHLLHLLLMLQVPKEL